MSQQPPEPPQGPPPGYGYPPQGPPPPGYGYPPPGYGYPPQSWGPARGTNTLAIVALVSIFVFAPAALVLGIIARKQIQETGEDGSGMALAAIICGAVSVVFFVLVLGLVLTVFAFGAGTAGSLHSVVVTPR